MLQNLVVLNTKQTFELKNASRFYFKKKKNQKIFEENGEWIYGEIYEEALDELIVKFIVKFLKKIMELYLEEFMEQLLGWSLSIIEKFVLKTAWSISEKSS